MTDPAIKMMSDAEYVACAGNLCPFCRSSDIESQGKPEVDEGGSAGQRVKCNTCDREWSDEYRLVGWQAL